MGDQPAATPCGVFLKVCYDLSRDVREGHARISCADRNRERDRETSSSPQSAPWPGASSLAYGTMLGDVVGLGKTLTAVAVALMLRDEKERPDARV